MNMFNESDKSGEEFGRLIKELKDFGDGKQPSKPVLAKDMTLRDHFAASALVKFLADNSDDPDAFGVIAWRAYKMADAMLEERDSK